MLAKV